jgi:hypothetical protein
MSNETPVTLEQCIAWLCQALQKLPPMDRHYNLGETAPIINAILSHLRASAAKGWPEDALILRHSLDHNNGTATHVMIERELVARLMNMLRATPGEAKCSNEECEEGQVPDETACWKPCPDCAPSPEQKGADDYRSCPGCRDLEQHQSQCLVEQQGAEQPLYNSVPLPQGVQRVHDVRIDQILCGYEDFDPADMFEIRSLAYEVRNFRLRTAPAPALGLSKDELDALGWGIAACIDSQKRARANDKMGSVRLYERTEATLRSLLERGGV